MNTDRHGLELRRSKQGLRRICAVVVFLVVAVIGSMILTSSRTYVPTACGKTLDVWLSEKIGIEPLSDEAAEAIRSMGTNALPRLLELLGHEDSTFRAWAYVHLSNRKWSPVRLTPYYVIQGRGAEGIKALGPVAKPARPLLSKMFYEQNGSQWDVADALMSIGPEGMKVVQDGLLSTNAYVRRGAIIALTGLDQVTPDVISSCQKALSDADLHVREAATNALNDFAAKHGKSDYSAHEAK